MRRLDDTINIPKHPLYMAYKGIAVLQQLRSSCNLLATVTNEALLILQHG